MGELSSESILHLLNNMPRVVLGGGSSGVAPPVQTVPRFTDCFSSIFKVLSTFYVGYSTVPPALLIPPFLKPRIRPCMYTLASFCCLLTLIEYIA
jgi:hypothetical protein